jgi:Tol biopolymer transport system component
LRRFTIDPAEERYSAWTPNGKRIAFGSHRGGEAGMWWQAADGTVPERLADFRSTDTGTCSRQRYRLTVHVWLLPRAEDLPIYGS